MKQGKHKEKVLSAATIRGLTGVGRYPDGNGLYLVISETGNKKWVLRTVVKGRRRDIGLGGLSTTTLAEAREEALRLRKVARSGGDPLAERLAAKRVIPTFRQAATTVHESHKDGWKNPKHQDQWINTLTEYACPYFGDKTVDEVDSADVLRALAPIWLTKPETARRVKQRIKSVFDWAKASGLRTGDNPIEGVTKALPKQSDVQRHLAALPYRMINEFIGVIHSQDAATSVKLGLEFVILTACRSGEARGAEWQEFDRDNRVWTVPASRMKAKREHRVPLSDRCLSILEECASLFGTEGYVFPGRKKGRPLSDMAFLQLIRRTGADAVPHGFRSTFRDWAAEQTDYPRDVIEAALAHTLRDKTEAAYKRTDLFDKRRDLMRDWQHYIATARKLTVAQTRARQRAIIY